MPRNNATNSKRWRERHPDYNDATNAERQARHRRKQRPIKARCSVCGEPLWGDVSIAAGLHQKCDRAAYMQMYRKLKRRK